MSVLITGVNMPSFGEGNELIVRVLPNGAVLDEHGIYLNAKAISVPPHGDLIDRDKFRGTMFIGEQCLYSWDEIEDAIDYAPTIIPAEENKHND